MLQATTIIYLLHHSNTLPSTSIDPLPPNKAFIVNCTQQSKQSSMDPVTGAIGKLAPMLVDLLKDEYKLQKGVKVQIRSLARELESAHAALWMLAEVPPEEPVDPQVRLWARDVRDASYDMVDILDNFQARIGDGVFFSLSKVKARRKIARAIEDIMKQLKEVTELRGRYAVNSILGKPDATSSSIDPRPAAFPNNNMPRLIGTNKAMSELLLGDGGYNTLNPAEHQEITRQLVGVMQPVGMKDMPDLKKWIAFDEQRKQLGVLSIVGLAGMGKTTAAMALYRELGSQFQKRAVVTVSQNSDPEAVLRSILYQVKPQMTNNNSMGTTLEKNNPVIGSILKRIRLKSRMGDDDGSERLTVRGELKKYLEQNRCRHHTPLLVLFINCLEHRPSSPRSSIMLHLLMCICDLLLLYTKKHMVDSR